jgi:hypothetical protein
MPVATVLASAVHQALDLALGEIASLDCQVYDAWATFPGCRFHADKPFLRGNDCLAYMLFLNSQLRLLSRSRPINCGGIQPGLFPPPRCENYLLSYARSIGAVDTPPGRGTYQSGQNAVDAVKELVAGACGLKSFLFDELKCRLPNLGTIVRIADWLHAPLRQEESEWARSNGPIASGVGSN